MRAVVLVGGAVIATATLRARLVGCDLVIAADGGLRHAAALGLVPDLLVGDLDSVDAAVLAAHPGLESERHPTDKDALDLELALDAAAARGAGRITVVGGLSGRLDQTLATVLVVQARHAASAAARERIEAAVARLGYRRNDVARGLVTGRSGLVGVVLPDLIGPVYAHMARGIEDVLDEHGMHAMLVTDHLEPEAERRAVELLRARQVDGLV
ncbi:MAG: thiamine diphosphokinase, partial [Trueperaceae bacterium]